MTRNQEESRHTSWDYILKWNQEDLGQALHTRLGICTTVRDPGPRPLGSHKANCYCSCRMTLAPQEGRDELPQGQGRLKIRQHGSTWIGHLDYELSMRLHSLSFDDIRYNSLKNISVYFFWRLPLDHIFKVSICQHRNTTMAIYT